MNSYEVVNDIITLNDIIAFLSHIKGVTHVILNSWALYKEVQKTLFSPRTLTFNTMDVLTITEKIHFWTIFHFLGKKGFVKIWSLSFQKKILLGSFLLTVSIVLEFSTSIVEIKEEPTWRTHPKMIFWLFPLGIIKYLPFCICGSKTF